MFPFHWLTTLQQQYRSRFRQGARFRQHRSRHACTPCIARATPRHAVELLEDRMLLTAFTVVNTDDSGAGSLRDAIEQANANAGADTISFDAALAGQSILLNNQLRIRDDLTIIGLGSDQLTIDANHNSRIFDVYDGTHRANLHVSISGLTLANGDGFVLPDLENTTPSVGLGGSITYHNSTTGGAIFNYEHLTVSDLVFQDNRARQGGAIFTESGAGATMSVENSVFLRNQASDGGAIYGRSPLTVIDSSFVENQSTNNGGAIYAYTLTVSGSSFTENSAQKSGGAIYHLTGEFQVSDSTFDGNVAGQYGGGIYHSYRQVWNWGGTTIPDRPDAGLRQSVVYLNPTEITNCEFIENSAANGGGIYSVEYIAQQNPAIDSSADPNQIVNTSSSFEFENSFDPQVILRDCSFTGNTAELGGGIFNRSGEMQIILSSFRENSVTGSGGGLCNSGSLKIERSSFAENSANAGGGLLNSGNLLIEANTISGNHADYGGGVYILAGQLALQNSTISGNRAGFIGGGIYSGPNVVHETGVADYLVQDIAEARFNPLYAVDYNSSNSVLSTIEFASSVVPNSLDMDRSTIAITNSTITGNSANSEGGGIYGFSSITNSIVAGNTAQISPQITGAFSENSNIIQDSIQGLLDPVLRDNGGPTKTHALLFGSAAINAGDNAAAEAADLTHDQRGSEFGRIFDDTVDIGAYELHSMSFVVDTNSDIDDGDYSLGQLSLRESIKLANMFSTHDTITFAASLAGQTIILNSELLISDDLTITGLGAEQLTISGNHNSRIFNIDDGDKNTTITVEISGLTLTEGYAENGGAILNNEILSITESTVSASEAILNGGGIYQAAGLLTIADTLFADNRANQDGGGLYNSTQDLEISGGTFLRNVADRNGGGVYTLQGVSSYALHEPSHLSEGISLAYFFPSYDYEYNSVTITDSSFIENSATSGGGVYGGYTGGPLIIDFLSGCDVIIPSVVSQATTSGHSNSEFLLVDIIFMGNTAEYGGAISNSAGLLNLKNSSIQNNSASYAGGGIYNHGRLIIEENTISENTARVGGGIKNSSGNMTIKNSTLSNNTATQYGGGISNLGSLSIINSTLSGNRSGNFGGGVFQYSGGSFVLLPQISLINSEDPSEITSPTNLIDQTLSVFIYPLFATSSSLNIINSTITGNSAEQSGGGIASPPGYNYNTTATITNSIVAGNTAAAFAQVDGPFVYNSNIIQDSIEGLLDPVLRDNGGSTKTHALLSGSAAINAGSNQAASEAGLITDQRGEGSQRFKEGTVDIGAFEVQAPFTQVDFRFANSNSRKLNNGEQEQLPENRIWLDEAGNYWVEIWLHTPTSTTAGIQSGYFDLNYNTSAATAVSIEYGAAFAQNQSGTINQNTGTIENLSAETSRTDVGDDQYTLFARIQFHANMTESTDGERGRHPRTSVVNPGITVTQLNIRLTGGAASEAIVNQSPGDPIWEDPQPASDIPAFDDLVLENLQFDYYVQPDNFFAASHISPNNESTYHSGLTLIDLPGSPVVDEAGNETGMLNELDSLIGSRDETEDDLPKKTTSTDHDSSAEEDADQFFSDLTEETELIVF
tara:strand:- start:5633 stop:10372 length:4740 start_codon:yes stop_codon:yes gene_type:complete